MISVTRATNAKDVYSVANIEFSKCLMDLNKTQKCLIYDEMVKNLEILILGPRMSNDLAKLVMVDKSTFTCTSIWKLMIGSIGFV